MPQDEDICSRVRPTGKDDYKKVKDEPSACSGSSFWPHRKQTSTMCQRGVENPPPVSGTSYMLPTPLNEMRVAAIPPNENLSHMRGYSSQTSSLPRSRMV